MEMYLDKVEASPSSIAELKFGGKGFLVLNTPSHSFLSRLLNENKTGLVAFNGESHNRVQAVHPLDFEEILQVLFQPQ
jgi:hypothetical protein